MPTEILMPALSPTMEEGTLARWLVREGDQVSSGDLLAEIETDKATMEFEAVDEGIIGKILVAEGAQGVKVNSPIAILLGEGESASDISTAAPAAPAPAKPADRPPIPEEAGKAADGPSSRHAAPAPAGAGGDRVFASPLARRIASDKGVDLARVSGSGPHGRIVKADVESARSAPGPAAMPAAASEGPSADMVIRMYEGREFEEKTLDGMRRTVAARLSEAKRTVPHFYLRREIRLDSLLAFRSALNSRLEARGVKLSVNDFVVKACAVALQDVPAANAVWAGDRILEMNASDIAVAVAVEGGLFTPVLKDAEKKSLSALSNEMKELAARARERKLAPHEYLGGSFAISNLGMYGIDEFDAVINPPHGSILAVGAGARKPVVGEDGELTVATSMSVTLSVDHRVIDGALGAEFLGAIKDNLENPAAMLA